METSRQPRSRKSFVVVVAVLAMVFPPMAGPLMVSAAEAGGNRLVAVAVPGTDVPSGDGLIVFGRNTYEPGARGTCACPDEEGTVVAYVEAGTMTFEIEAGGRVIRAANSDNPVEEEIATGTPFTASVGDAVVFPDKHRVETNEGDEPATYVFALFLAPVPPPPPDPTDLGVVTTDILVVQPGIWPDFSAGSVMITFARVTLEPGDTVDQPAGGLQMAILVEAVDESTPVAAVPGGPDGGVANVTDDALEVYIVTVAPEEMS